MRVLIETDSSIIMYRHVSSVIDSELSLLIVHDDDTETDFLKEDIFSLKIFCE